VVREACGASVERRRRRGRTGWFGLHRPDAWAPREDAGRSGEASIRRV